jgi:nicotinamide riboside kinase
MTIPVLVTALENRFEAVLAGTPEVRGAGVSRNDAIESLKAEHAQRTQRGELVWVDFEPSERHQVTGSFADDDTLPELCAEIYRQRDADLSR